MRKKIFIVLFLLIILIANMSFAAYSDVTMNVTEEPVCTISLGGNSSFEKKLVSKDLENKEVTIQLKVTNNEEVKKPTGEIVLVIDNSNSMKESTSSGETRGEVITESAKTFVTNLLKDNNKLKVGAVSFSSSSEKNTEGFVTLGTEKDATLLSELTNDVSSLSNAINKITYADDTVASYTNLQAGLSMAKKLFSSEDTDKYMIVLTDGVPNVILNKNDVKYDDTIISNTKNEYQSIIASGIKVITMLSGIENDTLTIPTSEYKYSEYIEAIFGTTENPNYGTFYYIKDNDIEKTIKEDIYNSLIPVAQSLKNIKVVDYFPDKIIKNFDFGYVQKANVGEISAKVDETNNSITWTIPELASGESAIVQYKLKLKENYDNNIVNTVLDTNEKVDITYNDLDGKAQNKTSDVTPKLKLTEPAKPTIFPKAGMTYTLIGFIAISFGILVYSLIRLTIINKNLKH